MWLNLPQSGAQVTHSLQAGSCGLMRRTKLPRPSGFLPCAGTPHPPVRAPCQVPRFCAETPCPAPPVTWGATSGSSLFPRDSNPVLHPCPGTPIRFFTLALGLQSGSSLLLGDSNPVLHSCPGTPIRFLPLRAGGGQEGVKLLIFPQGPSKPSKLDPPSATPPGLHAMIPSPPGGAAC